MWCCIKENSNIYSVGSMLITPVIIYLKRILAAWHKFTLLWHMTSSSRVDWHQRLGEINCLHLQDRRSHLSYSLKNKATGSSETLVPITRLHGATLLKNVTLIQTTVRTSDIVSFFWKLWYELFCSALLSSKCAPVAFRLSFLSFWRNVLFNTC